MKHYLLTLCCSIMLMTSLTAQTSWPDITSQTKPWSRWWWHGSAVTREGITAELEAFQKAGLGGLEITPIYGVYGTEHKFVQYLSPQWMLMLMHTLQEADRLGLGIDMATGTGWPFGGPWVTEADACKNIEYRIYELAEGEILKEKIEFVQKPLLRAVGNQIYKGSIRDKDGKVNLPVADLITLSRPIQVNKNLQALAIDQVRFERKLSLKALMAFNEENYAVNLITHLDNNNMLRWKAASGNWKIYAVFEGSHGKLVERAGPGGEGNVIDHFSASAVKHYLAHFDSAMQGYNVKSLRAFFNDSYEVDDAQGAADWTPELFDAFKAEHDYDLRDHLPALFNKDPDQAKNERILSDYRETIGNLMLDHFTLTWKKWANGKDAVIRNQAHGSPANILDLYAAVDIPEIEGTEPLRVKMASSAANVAGKKLVSSESATWLNEHFESNLGDIKKALDLFFLNGVNHIFYHGTCYSPKEEPWPGWLFYAAVHLNPRNPLWRDFETLNKYVARCQSVLQTSKADHDVLLYFPIYDRLSVHGPEMVEHFDGVGKQFENTAFARCAEFMLDRGYSFDFISDKQMANLKVTGNKIATEGGNLYKTVVIPHCKYIHLATLHKILSLVSDGAQVIMYDGLPESAAGYRFDGKSFVEAIKKIKTISSASQDIMTGNDLANLLSMAGIQRESMIDHGIDFDRKISAEGHSVYFIAGKKETSFEGWVALERKGVSAVLMDPMTGDIGKAKTRVGAEGKTEVYLQLTPSQSMILNLCDKDVDTLPFKYIATMAGPMSLSGVWEVSFLEGGPILPSTVSISTLKSWTEFDGDGFKEFSGTAKYVLPFAKPSLGSGSAWLLDLGEVRESAAVVLNGKLLGTLIGPSYRIVVDGKLLMKQNVLEVHVSNLMANRIADLDKRSIPWKKFYNVNFPARKNENRFNGLFDASHWAPRPSGLLGPVSLTPLE